MNPEDAALQQSLGSALEAISVCRYAALLRCTTDAHRLEVNAHYLSILSSLRQMSAIFGA